VQVHIDANKWFDIARREIEVICINYTIEGEEQCAAKFKLNFVSVL